MVTVAAVIAHGHVAVVYEQYENQLTGIFSTLCQRKF